MGSRQHGSGCTDTVDNFVAVAQATKTAAEQTDPVTIKPPVRKERRVARTDLAARRMEEQSERTISLSCFQIMAPVLLVT